MILGVDASTTAVGFALLTMAGELAKSWTYELKEKDYHSRLRELLRLLDLPSGMEYAAIEADSSGRNLRTTVRVAQFVGAVKMYIILSEILSGQKCEFVDVNRARALSLFGLGTRSPNLKERVQRALNAYFGTDGLKTEHEADAALCALSCWKDLNTK